MEAARGPRVCIDSGELVDNEPYPHAGCFEHFEEDSAAPVRVVCETCGEAWDLPCRMSAYFQAVLHLAVGDVLDGNEHIEVTITSVFDEEA